jgi:hypothetical protein
MLDRMAESKVQTPRFAPKNAAVDLTEKTGMTRSTPSRQTTAITIP